MELALCQGLCTELPGNTVRYSLCSELANYAAAFKVHAAGRLFAMGERKVLAKQQPEVSLGRQESLEG